MNDFLPKDYETPEIPSHYMELEEGVNTFRILSSAIVGYEWWVDSSENGRKPMRVRTADEVPEEVRSATRSGRRPSISGHFQSITIRLNPFRCLNSNSRPS